MKINDDYSKVERWGIFELKLQGPENGNPFVDIQFSAQFRLGDQMLEPAGFYDGKGSYKVRFMPNALGQWTYTTKSNVTSLNGKTGQFFCIEPAASNHGPVGVHNQHHFCYADGTPYLPFGTTCYAWAHQGAKLEEQTLVTLKNAPFNKLRMCVLPKNYTRNQSEPEIYPFEGTPPLTWDFTRLNPDFFRHLESRISALMDLGIETDLILFHPYDKGHWGFDRMGSETDARYLRYVIARLGAYRNVWWALANEYDYMHEKKEEDWEKLFQVVVEADCHKHLLSIHNGDILYDHGKPFITHASVQLGTPKDGLGKHGWGRYRMLRDAYKKPVIYDEIGYEGDMEKRWGCLPAQELLHRIWTGIVSGTYVTHGETFDHPEAIIWWAKGGVLHGQTPARIAFLRKIMEESPSERLEPIDKWWLLNVVGQSGQYYLYYFGCEVLTEWKFSLPAMGYDIPLGTQFQVDVIDTWNMTITPIRELYEITDKEAYAYMCKHNPTVKMPGREYMALRIRRVVKS